MKTEDIKQQTIVFGPCCFCGESIHGNDIDPCRLKVETSSGNWQVWFCHAACFKNRLTDNEELDLSPAHF
jgi:hypothetical protein